MKKYFFFIAAFLICCIVDAQSTADHLIEGSKTLVELISIFKKNKSPAVTGSPVAGNNNIDSCILKQQSDLCFKNSSSRDLAISIFRRTDAAYETVPFTVKVISKKTECLYELKSGIYKYRIETGNGADKVLVNEGEFRLQPCDNMKREIKE